MKKALTVALILVITGCAAADGDDPLDGVAAETIAQAIMAEIEIPAVMPKGLEDMVYFVSDLDTAGVQELSYYISASGFNPDELLIIKFNTSEEAAAAKAAVESRLESRITDFRDYAPAEMFKLDNAGIQINNNWLFYFVTEDNARVREIINSYLSGA
jgi:hypothetical protein